MLLSTYSMYGCVQVDNISKVYVSKKVLHADGKTILSTVYSIQYFNGSGLKSREEFYNADSLFTGANEFTYDKQGEITQIVELSADNKIINKTIAKKKGGELIPLKETTGYECSMENVECFFDEKGRKKSMKVLQPSSNNTYLIYTYKYGNE